MKKRIIRIGIIVLSALLCVAVLRAALIYYVNYDCKNYFDSEYKQIVFPTSISDYITARKVLKNADAALSTITTYENAYNKFGELWHLCVTDEDSVAEKHKLRLVAANFSKDTGYIWVKYSSEAYDEAGEVTTGSWDILAKWELEKQEGQWVVTDTNEPP